VGTRHNAGFEVVAHVAARSGIRLESRAFEGRIGHGQIGGEDVALLLPATYMNASGRAVAAALAAHGGMDPARDLLIAYDDADLPLGRLRMRERGSAGGHNGLGDVLDALGSDDVPRLRFGIGRPNEPVDTVDFVLSPFSPDEEPRVRAALDRAAAAVDCFVREGAVVAMNQFNQADPIADPKEDEAVELPDPE
jgi:PTH1 family peptidyl-tRNA hydrolase